jgi:Peptidyl-prolyl cis-trans isomerase (rotamase) - cyclophilin family
MSPSSAKRHRKRQNAAAARAAQLEAARQAKRRQTLIRGGIVGTLVIAVFIVLAFVNRGGDDGKQVAATDESTTTTTAADESTTTTPETTATTVAGAGTAEITCNDAEPQTKGNGKTYDKAPEMTIDPAKKYTATMDTSCGKMVIELDAKNAPVGTNNFVFLAREKFYDGLPFHRVIQDFVIQGGAPDGDGTKGPGYDVPAEPPKDKYKIGDLAAAKAATDPPGTMGSQFFVITGSRGAGLTNEYARFGTVTDGVKVAQKLESFGQPDETPSRKLWIFSVTIAETPA